MERTYLIRTFGCQMNEHDSERIAGLLRGRRHDGRPRTSPTRVVVVFNTCAIRENADNRLYGNLGHLKPLKDANPRSADRRGGLPRAEGPGRDPAARARGSTWWSARTRCRSCSTCSKRPKSDGPQMDVREYTEVFPSALPAARQTRSARGSRSRRAATTRARSASCRSSAGRSARARSATSWPRCRGSPDRGVVEVTLLGQNVNTYRPRRHGAGLAEPPAVRGAPATRWARSRASGGSGSPRPHPHDFTPDVIEAMAETPAVCEHIHFPLQSGSDRVLKAMQRSYRRERYLGWLDAIRAGDPRHRGLDRHHRRVPRRDRGGLRRHARRRGARAVRQRVHVPVLAAPGHARRRRSTTRSRRRSCRSGSTGWWRCRSASRWSAPRAQVGRTFEVLVEGAGKRGAVHAGADADEPDRAPAPTLLEPGTFVQTRDHRRGRAPPDRRARSVAGGRGRLAVADMDGAAARARGPDGLGQDRGRARARAEPWTPRSSRSTRCSSTAGWTSAPRSPRPPSAPACRTT